MKDPQELVSQVAGHLARTWENDAAGIGGAWPRTWPIGAVSSGDLRDSFAQVQASALELQRWARQHQLALTMINRSVHGTTQPLPSHVTVDSATVAATLAGQDWVHRLGRGHARAQLVNTRAPGLTAVQVAALVRTMDTWTDLDVELAIQAGTWFAEHDASGLTPRQVRLERGSRSMTRQG